MNDQIKKQTNLGIILAIIGFAMIGGALVLVPRLVDEKVKSIRLKDKNAATAVSDASDTQPVPPDRIALSDSQSNIPPDAAPSAASASKPDHTGTTQSQLASAATPPKAEMSPVEATPSAPETSENDTWEIVLGDKYEPNDASIPRLQTVIILMKSNPAMRIRVLGMNNFNKMSRLAQIGANRIAATIMKEAGVPSDRIDVAVEQKTDMTDIRVSISVVGGDQ